MDNDVIEREIEIAAPVDRVWSLVTEAAHLGTWFGDEGAAIDLRPGGALEVRWSDHLLTGVVAAVEPKSRFAFRWRQVDGAHDAELGEGNSTLVEFTLTGEGEGTRLRLVESGFASLGIPGEKRRSLFDSHTEGWRIELGELAGFAAGVEA